MPIETPSFPLVFGNAIRYWEPRRVVYNAALAIVTIAWFAITWPHFRPMVSPQSLLPLLVLAGIANVCYCAAYAVDLPAQFSEFRAAWIRRRWTLWLGGTIFAIILANYWIVDEIYPYVS